MAGVQELAPCSPCRNIATTSVDGKTRAHKRLPTLRKSSEFMEIGNLHADMHQRTAAARGTYQMEEQLLSSASFLCSAPAAESRETASQDSLSVRLQSLQKLDRVLVGRMDNLSTDIVDKARLAHEPRDSGAHGGCSMRALRSIPSGSLRSRCRVRLGCERVELQRA